jgi:very-short-patch-repair endonuclease
MSSATIARRKKSGQLVHLLPSVYATEKPDYLGLCTAVTLWKPDAVMSHLTAAWLWNLVAKEPETVSVTLPLSAQRHAPNWVVVHRRHVSQTCRRYELAVVSKVQAFVDVAATLTGDDLERFFDTAIRTPAERRELAIQCQQLKGMAGMKTLRRQLRTCVLGTRSEVERIVARAMSERNFFMEINAQVGPYFGDFVDRRARVIVEIDGREFHISPDAFNNDRRRQNKLVLGGWMVLRYSAVQVMAGLDRVVDEIIAVVRRRRRR